MLFDKIYDLMNLDNIKRRQQEKYMQERLDEAKENYAKHFLSEVKENVVERISLEVKESIVKQTYPEIKKHLTTQSMLNANEKHAEQLINKAIKLADIINTTTNETKFYSSYDRIIKIFEELTQYESQISFSYPPSKNLQEIKDKKYDAINAFKKRCISTSIKTTDHYSYSDNEIEQPYFSPKIIIEGLNFYFISVARDIVSQNQVNELSLKRSYNLDSNSYSELIQQLKDAKIIDSSNNILMSLDALEHFFDIYQPKLFSCTHGDFDKDIFTCLGEIIIEDGIKHAEQCFSSIDELLDYLKIMEKLNIIKFNNGNYDVICTMETFHNICKGVPEYYSTLKPATLSSDAISSIDYDSLSGRKFEFFCADLLLQNGFQNVSTTKTSGDHGVDIFAEKDGNTYAFQCKCYSGNVGNSAIQEVLAGKKLYRKDIAVVLTNRFFTTQAIEEATALGVKLWDRDKLEELIKGSVH